MMERHYSFAGLEFTVSMPEDVFYTNERFLAPFRVETVKDAHVFLCESVEALTPPEGTPTVQYPNVCVYPAEDGHVRYIGGAEPYIRAAHAGKRHHVQVKKNSWTDRIGAKSVLEAMEAEHLVARNFGFLFHCACIAVNGNAILFTAPSETGKTTQAELWHRHRGAEIINGDRAAVRLADGVLLAEGIPFAGSSVYCRNASLPIAAIVYLAQAPETSIRKMRGYEAFSRIWEGVSVNTWDREDMERVSAVVKKLAENVPVFYLPCTPDESAVTALEEALKKEAAK